MRTPGVVREIGEPSGRTHTFVCSRSTDRETIEPQVERALTEWLVGPVPGGLLVTGREFVGLSPNEFGRCLDHPAQTARRVQLAVSRDALGNTADW